MQPLLANRRGQMLIPENTRPYFVSITSQKLTNIEYMRLGYIYHILLITTFSGILTIILYQKTIRFKEDAETVFTEVFGSKRLRDLSQKYK